MRRLTEQLFVRITAEELAEIKAYTSRINKLIQLRGNFATTNLSEIVREAIKIGLPVLERSMLKPLDEKVKKELEEQDGC